MSSLIQKLTRPLSYEEEMALRAKSDRFLGNMIYWTGITIMAMTIIALAAHLILIST